MNPKRYLIIVGIFVILMAGFMSYASMAVLHRPVFLTIGIVLAVMGVVIIVLAILSDRKK